MPGPLELGVILLVILLLFGAKKLPETARGLGRSITEFKAGMKDEPPAEEPSRVEAEAADAEARRIAQ